MRYMKTYSDAVDVKNMILRDHPQARIVAYKRGYAVQYSDSSNYWPDIPRNLKELLVTIGIIDRSAVEDPEGYDNFATIEKVETLKKALSPQNQP